MRAILLAGLLIAACNRPEGGAKAQPQERTDPSAAPVPGPSGASPSESMVAVGKPAPAFSGQAHTGQQVSLEGLRGKVVVLYFYPKDGTPGCTLEAEQFRDYHGELENAGAVIVGVSSDDNESHKDFAEELGLPFLLLPDQERVIAGSYGVGGFLGMSKRMTFLIDQEGRIAKIYPSVTPKEHALEILRDVQALAAATDG